MFRKFLPFFGATSISAIFTAFAVLLNESHRLPPLTGNLLTLSSIGAPFVTAGLLNAWFNRKKGLHPQRTFLANSIGVPAVLFAAISGIGLLSYYLFPGDSLSLVNFIVLLGWGGGCGFLLSQLSSLSVGKFSFGARHLFPVITGMLFTAAVFGLGFFHVDFILIDFFLAGLLMAGWSSMNCHLHEAESEKQNGKRHDRESSLHFGYTENLNVKI